MVLQVQGRLILEAAFTGINNPKAKVNSKEADIMVLNFLNVQLKKKMHDTRLDYILKIPL